MTTTATKTRIYVDRPLAKLIEITIDDPQRVHHLTRVIKITKSDKIEIFDNQSRQYCAQVETIQKKAVVLSLHEQLAQKTESPLNITLGQAISRSQRMNYTVQKATELGVTTITPLYSQYSQINHCNLARINHWRAVACKASEQSGRTRVPEITVACNLSKWLTSVEAQIKLVLHESAATSYDFTKEPTPQKLAILIGAEGGLSKEEVSQAKKHGFVAIQLGPRVLRCETATPVALTLAQWYWGDFHG